ncbi:mandelate racemase/muconate lactonizing enzyme family protein [Paraflavisolibacter sp. H34]|uniref:mandelate racemase/muconate lactonizing enzyme family protein n=1 Tax=Huijunlia imazamoxiresistens TaxID=3127457 RepID=UPI003017E611
MKTSLAALSPVAAAVLPATVVAAKNREELFSPGKGAPALKITGIDVHVVQVNQRGNWVLIELKTNKGLTGLGEASQGSAGTSAEGQAAIRSELAAFFELVRDQSPFDIEKYRQKGWHRARASRLAHTAFSGIEQALWDLKGKALGVPVYQLLGGKVRDSIRTYANINRATNVKDANGRRPVAAFRENAEKAVQRGFRAIKMAPFDEMKALDQSEESRVQADIDHALSCIEGVRQTIGEGVELLVDVHSHLDQPLGMETARRVAPYRLFWLEEPVNPEKFVAVTRAIKEVGGQPLAGGESIFGREGFAPLVQAGALDIVMPDVKHCGGILELTYIAALAGTAGLQVAPHNPSGPVATAASAAVCAGLSNFSILEYAFGEVPWSPELVLPFEQFVNGEIPVSDLPGLGIELNRQVLKKHVL